MFDAYVSQDANKNRRRRWVGVVVTGSVLAHLVVVIAVMVAGMWKVEKNPYKGNGDILVRTFHAGVAAPPPLGSKQIKKKQKKQLIKKRLVKNRQPTKQRASLKIEQSDGGGEGPGRPDGKIGGTGDDPNAEVTSLTACKPGDICGKGIPNVPSVDVITCPGPHPSCKPKRTKIVAANMISGSRISGTSRILPPDAIKARIANEDKTQVVGAVLMCLSSTGGVSKAKMVRSTGYNAYDQKILHNVRRWRYRPYKVNGTAVPVCTSITFVYRQTR